MSRNSAAENAGQKWTKEEDEELLKMLEENPDAHYEFIAEHFKRTPGSVQNRALNIVLLMAGTDGSLEDLCRKYNLDMKEMDKYKSKKENRLQARRENRRQTPSSRDDGLGGSEVLSVLKDIRSYMRIMLDKLEDYPTRQQR